jgi:oligoribonuclease NrnB/cAMP/cGMP phosphodiesterase (DHH superfamily)
MLKDIHVFTDIDLDGTGSLLALHWYYKCKLGDITFKGTTVSNFRKEFLKWAEDDSLNNYKINYFLDLDTSTCSDLIDTSSRTCIIDHHLTHVNAIQEGVYKNATTKVIETTSCTKLCYKHFQLNSLTPQQKYFVALVDDYDSYQFKLPETYDLNCLYTNTQKTLDVTRQHKFLERFYNGFDGFTTQEKNIIKEHKLNRDKVISDLQIFAGDVSLNKNKYRVVGTMTSKFVNDVCDYLIKNHKADIVFSINPNNQHVSWRKNKDTCPIDLSKLAAKVSDGGGHEYAAGGKVNDTFMEFTKQLSSITKE